MPSARARFEVDDEIEFGLDWSTGSSAGFATLENVAGIDADLMKHLRKVASIAH